MINKTFIIKKALKIQKNILFYIFYMFLNTADINGIVLNFLQSIIFFRFWYKRFDIKINLKVSF